MSCEGSWRSYSCTRDAQWVLVQGCAQMHVQNHALCDRHLRGWEKIAHTCRDCGAWVIEILIKNLATREAAFKSANAYNGQWIT